MSDSPTGKLYLGVAYNKSTATESTNYSDYSWSLIKGDKGDRGATGAAGPQGATGPQGIKGDKGATGAQGPTGATGNGIKSITYTYTRTTSQTAPAASSITSTTMPTLDAANKYLWQKEVITYTNNQQQTTVLLLAVYGDRGATGAKGDKGATGATGPQGVKGDKGATGAQGPTGPQGVKGNDGKGIKSTSVTYQIWSNGTSTPTGTWSSTPPKTTADKPYLWTRTIITYTDGSTSPPSYSVGSTPEGVEEKVDKNIRDQIASSEKTIEESYKALINQTARDITGIVEKLQKETTDNSTTISQFSTNLKMTTDGLSVTKSAITTLKDAVNGKVDSNELKQYLDWDGDNLILSTSANKFKCMLSNTELGFYQGKTKVAWISNEELYVLKAIIAKSIGCGNFLFVDEGDLGLSLI